MLTCKEASYLASKKLDKKLTQRERIELLLHTLMCRLCRHYAREMKSLHALLIKVGQSGQSLLPETTRLSEKSRDRIKKALVNALHQSES